MNETRWNALDTADLRLEPVGSQPIQVGEKVAFYWDAATGSCAKQEPNLLTVRRVIWKFQAGDQELLLTKDDHQVQLGPTILPHEVVGRVARRCWWDRAMAGWSYTRGVAYHRAACRFRMLDRLRLRLKRWLI